jgi:hypothetical protein
MRTRAHCSPRLHRLALVALTAVLLAACAAGDGQGPLEIIGTYTDNYGGDNVITAMDWTQTYTGSAPYVFHILSYSNADNYLIAQNDAGNAFDGGYYSRFLWMHYNASLYYCQDLYNAATAMAARNAPLPVVTDPTASTACGGFAPWTELLPP